MTELAAVLESIGYTKLIDYGKQYSTRPLYRDSDNDTALTINKATGEWYDFVERIGGPLEALIEKTLGQPITPELMQRLETCSVFHERKADIEVPHTKTFDKTMLLKLKNDSQYWEGRGVSSRTLSGFNGGVALNGRMMNRYVFPIFNEKQDIIGFSGRYLWKSPYVPKWKHIGRKTEWLFPYSSLSNIMSCKEAILVESIGDMLALYEEGIQNVLVTFGVKISPKVIQFLLKADVRNIYIAFNNDSHNKFVGNIAAEKGKEKLKSYFDEKQLHIAVPTEKNDFGVMSSEEINLWKQQNLKSN